MENLFIIGFGLSGGFGGIHDYEVIEATGEIDAENQAYEKACEYYESYVGLYGLRDISQIMEEDDVDEEAAEQIYCEEMEDWLDYISMPYTEENLESIEGYNVYNPFE